MENQANAHPIAALLKLAEKMRYKQKNNSSVWNVYYDQTAGLNSEAAFDEALALYKAQGFPEPLSPMLQSHLLALERECRLWVKYYIAGQNLEAGDLRDKIAGACGDSLDEITERLIILADFGMPPAPENWPLSAYPPSFFDNFDKQTEQ